MLQHYTERQLTHWRALAADSKRHLYWAVPLTVAILGLVVHAPFELPLAGFAASIAGVIVQRAPGKRLRAVDPLLASWDAVVRRSDPAAPLTVGFSLREGEVVHYAERGHRCEERVTTHFTQPSGGSNGTSGAVLGTLLFGPAGGLVGRALTSRGGQSSAMAAHVYNVVPVDNGEVVVTSERFLFMGARNTVDVPLADVMRFSSIQGTHRVVVEYARRVPGESYTVDALTFAMCMARRARLPNFTVPAPPPPIPLTRAVVPEPVALPR